MNIACDIYVSPSFVSARVNSNFASRKQQLCAHFFAKQLLTVFFVFYDTTLQHVDNQWSQKIHNWRGRGGEVIFIFGFTDYQTMDFTDREINNAKHEYINISPPLITRTVKKLVVKCAPLATRVFFINFFYVCFWLTRDISNLVIFTTYGRVEKIIDLVEKLGLRVESV